MIYDDNKEYQVEIWQECNNHCEWCYLKDDNKFTPDECKIDSLNKILVALDEIRDKRNYNVVSYIGGEFFQGQLNNPEVHDKFMKVMEKTAKLAEDGIIHSVWLAATMTIGDQKDLWEALDYFKNIKSKGNKGMWIITSYDTKGRFHTPKMLETWENCVNKIHTDYPNYKINTTIILTADLIEKYMSGEFRFEGFCQKYNSSVFMKQPSPAINGDEQGIADFIKCKQDFQKKVPYMFTTRAKFIDFLKLMKMEEPHLYDKLFNIHYRADTLMRNYNNLDNHMVLNQRLKNSDIEMDVNTVAVKANKCGHPMDYTPYIDCNECCLCDKKLIDDLI